MRKSLILAAAAALLGSSCVGSFKAPFQPPTGAIFAQGKAPLSVDFDQTPVETAASGQASTLFVCIPFTYGSMSFAWDDASLERAARNGGVSKVQYADYEYFQILGLFGRMTVHARGEGGASR